MAFRASEMMRHTFLAPMFATTRHMLVLKLASRLYLLLLAVVLAYDISRKNAYAYDMRHILIIEATMRLLLASYSSLLPPIIITKMHK